jgi:hypothetical protein
VKPLLLTYLVFRHSQPHLEDIQGDEPTSEVKF